jgi:hypothetical protein
VEASIEPVTPDRIADLRNAFVDLLDKVDDMLVRQRCRHCHRLTIRDRDYDYPGSLMDFFTSGLCPRCFDTTWV